ncbi:hypothetical protein NPIL_311521 [Nephila pilipes]|uniref:Uncharacterized protein n=1 Tax=Nephila pilipes TaxID=299642 RepID=A0A8X6TPV1_NEPPI|nr:hypothetical protein NPIL_311521 [Nephila pilipes]
MRQRLLSFFACVLEIRSKKGWEGGRGKSSGAFIDPLCPGRLAVEDRLRSRQEGRGGGRVSGPSQISKRPDFYLLATFGGGIERSSPKAPDLSAAAILTIGIIKSIL